MTGNAKLDLSFLSLELFSEISSKVTTNEDKQFFIAELSVVPNTCLLCFVFEFV